MATAQAMPEIYGCAHSPREREIMPRLTVIMPVRNGQEFVRKAVVSTLRAMPSDAELRIIDDGSVDDTHNILSTFSDPRLEIASNTSSLGVARSLNAALHQSDSEFVARMDADDICLPWRFKRQLKVIKNSDFCFSPVVFISESSRPLRVGQLGVISPEALPLHLLLANILVHPTMLCQRQAITELNGYRVTPAEDYDLWLRAAAKGFALKRDGIPTLLYRLHKGQATKTGKWVGVANDPLLDQSFQQLYERLFSTRTDTTALRDRAASGTWGQIDSDTLEAFHGNIRGLTRRLAWHQKLLLNVRLKRIQDAMTSSG
jgi:hypothetical protein